MYSLIIDTAFESCQAGLWLDGNCLVSKSVQGGGKHDVLLAPMVQEIFKSNAVQVKGLKEIIVTTGPGRFTGLRVGIAFARGLALMHQTPLKGVLTADALRWQMENYHKQKNAAIVVAVKRGESFVQKIAPVFAPIERVMDTDFAACFPAGEVTHVAGMLSPDIQRILSDATHVIPVPELTEPSLEAIYAASETQKPEKSVLVRPYYAI